MKNFLFILSMLIVPVVIAGTDHNNASKKIVSGKIVDQVSGEAIAGAEVRIADKTIYSDLNGSFTACINLEKTAATVRFISYNETTIMLDPLSYETILIELSSK